MSNCLFSSFHPVCVTGQGHHGMYFGCDCIIKAASQFSIAFTIIYGNMSYQFKVKVLSEDLTKVMTSQSDQ